jgi:hypothetical protein
MKRYGTHKRAWIVALLALFLPRWFVPIIMEEIPPWVLIPVLFAFEGHFFETVSMLGVFVVLFGVPAVAVGWVLQCLYIVFATNRESNLESGR